MATPLFKTLSDEALRTEYAGYRNLAYNNAMMAEVVGVKRAAAQMGRLMNTIQLIENIARQRKINLAKVA